MIKFLEILGIFTTDHGFFKFFDFMKMSCKNHRIKSKLNQGRNNVAVKSLTLHAVNIAIFYMISRECEYHFAMSIGNRYLIQ